MSVHSELPLGNHPPSPLQTSCPAARGPIVIQDTGSTNTVLTQFPTSHRVNDAAGPLGSEGPLKMKNDILAPANMLQQPQKTNKRRYSLNMGFKHPGISKRRRRANSECDPVLPTNFLLGGNIFDPLNLNSLLDEEVNKSLNAQTPTSSPLPAKNRDPVEILIPKDITDPLNLNSTGGDATSGVLVSPIKSKRRHRSRHHAAVTLGITGQFDLLYDENSKVSEGIVSGSLPVVTSLRTEGDASAAGLGLLGLQAVEESPRPYELNTSINCRDEVVPPILPRRRSHPSSSSTAPQIQSRPTCSVSTGQQSKHKKRRRTNSRSDRLTVTLTPPTKWIVAEKMHSQAFHTPVVGGAAEAFSVGTQKIPQHTHKLQRKFQYGSYSRYYGYHTPVLNSDPRLTVFRPEWFHGKKVLDIGCNNGHITLAIARYWSPNHILGVDIDGMLVHAARQNLRYFLSELCSPSPGQEKTNLSGGEREGLGVSLRLTPLMNLQMDRAGGSSRFPLSFTRCRGPIATPPIMPHVPGLFPSNVSFLKGNYVPDTDTAVMSQSAEYDVILCLSLTKWVHLNFGDAGIQRVFHRIYRHLLPGGLLILEAQPWSSYCRSKRLTEVTHRNYSMIRLKPHQFSSFLTTEVGFSSYELISTPHSYANEFQRPIYVFHKGSTSNRK